MRERSIIHVAGPSGSGKTTFIEAVLETGSAIILAARCIRDDALRRPREANPNDHPELARYRAAGGSGAALFTFPGCEVGSDAFFLTNLMTDYSESVILEGDNPLEFVDLAVFVAPAPEAGETLFVRRKRDRAAEQRDKAHRMERLLRKPDGVAELLDLTWGGPIADFARKRPALLEQTRAKLLADLVAIRDLPPPKPTVHWAIADHYAGIGHAQLVVANIHDERERSEAERLIADVGRLRKEKRLFDDILGSRGTHTPITAVVANLADPNDAGRRKALARTRRALRSRSG
jgi:hypothetical protein